MGFLDMISAIFDPNEREVIKIRKIVDKINKFKDDMASKSDADLRALTDTFRKRLDNKETLDDILPEAFAAVREVSKRTIGLVHYDVQMIGGVVLHQGRISEMKTGEGKTLVATCPVYLNALTGKGVHVVTVNDYLAKRDGRWMAPIYHMLGMSVGIINHDAAYLYDPEVETGDESTTHLRKVNRQAAYAADITYGTNNEYGFDYLRDNMVGDLSEKVQRKLNFAIVDEVDSILIDEARTPLIISGRGRGTTNMYGRFAQVARELKRDVHYTVDEKGKSAPLTEEGVAKAEQLLGIKNLFDPENMGTAHFIDNALRAKECYRNEIEYVVKNNEVIIVDEFTGRLMFGRRYSDGLHQAIEAKEGVKVRQEDQTLATITFQNYFKLYNKLAGMTGTALTEEREFREIYDLDVVVIPTNQKVNRVDDPDSVYKNEAYKFKAVCENIRECHEKGQPVLVGTRSIEKSEQISQMLTKMGIKHNVLNAKYHEKEAHIIAQAGRLGAVSIATNMAGRGVDIKLGGDPVDKDEEAKVRAAGGLFIIGTERHESRRIDNQLRGRSGRQGDPGESKFYVALDDELMRLFASDRVRGMLDAMGMEDEEISNGLITRSIENAQSKVESFHFDIRKNVLKYDDTMNEQRRVIYADRDKILAGEGLRETVNNFIDSLVDDLVDANMNPDLPPDQWDFEQLMTSLHEQVVLPESASIEDLRKSLEDKKKAARDSIKDVAKKWCHDVYDKKVADLGDELMKEIERFTLLRVLDEHWIEHLSNIEALREGIGLRGYGQKDPKAEFIREAAEEFDRLKNILRDETLYNLFRLKFERAEQVENTENMQETRTNRDQEAQVTTIRKANKLGRNDLCWCGSGKKWKKCHYPEER